MEKCHPGGWGVPRTRSLEAGGRGEFGRMQSGRKAICLIHKTKGTGKGVGGFWSQEEKGRERERPVGASWKRSLGCFDPSGGGGGGVSAAGSLSSAAQSAPWICPPTCHPTASQLPAPTDHPAWREAGRMLTRRPEPSLGSARGLPVAKDKGSTWMTCVF